MLRMKYNWKAGPCAKCNHAFRFTNPWSNSCSYSGAMGTSTPRCGCDHGDEWKVAA